VTSSAAAAAARRSVMTGGGGVSKTLTVAAHTFICKASTFQSQLLRGRQHNFSVFV